MLFDELRELALLDELANLLISPAVTMVVMVVVMPVIMFTMAVTVLMLLVVMVVAMPMMVVLFLVTLCFRPVVMIAASFLVVMLMLFIVVMIVITAVTVLVVMLVTVLMLMGVPMFVRMAMLMLAMMMVTAAIAVFVMRGPFVNVEFHALDVLPLGAVVVHVKVAKLEFVQLPLEGAGLHAEIDKRADHHVAADSGNAVEIESFHARLLTWQDSAQSASRLRIQIHLPTKALSRRPSHFMAE